MSVSSDVTTVTNPLVTRAEREDQRETPVATTPSLNSEGQWDQTTKRTVLLVLLVISAGLLWLSLPALPLLAISGIVSYLLSPIVDLAERIRIPRYITTIILYMLVLIGLILLPFLLVPVLLDQLRSITDFEVYPTATAFIRWVTEWLNSIPDTIQIFGVAIPVGETLAEFQQNFEQTITVPTLADILYSLQQLAGTATSVVGSTASIGLSVVGGIVQAFVLFILTFFMSLYLTKDAPLIQAYVQDLFPRSFQPELSELIRRIRYIWRSFFRGQLLLCISIGIITWLALQLVGMPGALILGIVAGALEIIPNLGPTLATIPAVIIALIQGSDVLAAYGINNLGFAVITLAIYFIIQQLENSIIVPRVIGGSVNLHPIVIICGVVIGFNLAGIWGAFFAAPVIASLRIIGGYVHAKLLEYVPFQDDYFPPATPRRSFIYRRRLTSEELNTPPARPLAPATHGDSSPEVAGDDANAAG
jgi:predicted PurR-regulated permease PerM